MRSLLFYFFQTIICSGLLYGYYYIFLRNKKFHLYNRYYLLIAAVISTIIPLLNIPVYFAAKPDDPSVFVQALTIFSSDSSKPIVTTIGNSTTPVSFFFIWENILRTLYAATASIIFIRLLIAIFHIIRLIKSYVAEKIDRIYFINTNEPGTPFSFFKWLFWNKKIDLNSEKGGQMFRHELFHIRQKHSLDIVFFEMLTVVFWINPFFHFFKKEIKAIHEFLADEFAIKENAGPDDLVGREEWNYAELLLMQVLKSPNHLLNPFFHNQIKRRIAMITSSKKPSYQYLRKIMVLPVAAIVIVLFAFSYKQRTNQKTAESKITIQDTIKQKERNPNKQFTVNKIVDTLPKALKNKDYLIVVDGKIRDSSYLKNINPNNISSINVLKGDTAIAKYGDKGKNGVIEIITKAEIKKDATIESNIDVNNKIFQKIDSSSLTIEEERKTPEVNNQSEVDNIIFEKVEIEPSFPGGEFAWKQFLEKKLKNSVPAKNGAPNGIYTVWIEFTVDRQGNLSGLKAITKLGYGMEEECLRVLKLSPKWIPAMQNGHIVTAQKKQRVDFAVNPGKEVTNTNHIPTINDYNNPSNRNYNDPEFLSQRRQAIAEIKATARKEGRAAYTYKGRTYVFARINNPDPTIASFAEQDGTNHVFLLNGELVTSIDEINKRFTRNDVIKLSLISKGESIKRFYVNDAIVSIETFDNDLITKNK